MPAYRSARVVVDVGPPRNLDRSARVLDAVASGALVVTDEAEVSRELFDGQLPHGHALGEISGVGVVQLIVRDADGLHAACDPRKGGRPAGH